MLPFLVFVLFIDTPKPVSQWNVSFSPEIALLKSNGDSLLFSGGKLYRYDRLGNLALNATLEFVPHAAYVGPGDTIWVHDGNNRLALLKENNRLLWQQPMLPPAVAPFPLGDFLIYSIDDSVLMLDPHNGLAKYSFHHEKAISSVLSQGNWVLISNQEGSTMAWEAAAELEQLWYEYPGKQLKLLGQADDGSLALVYTGGLVRVFNAIRRLRWQRNYHIDVPVAPVWLKRGANRQVLVATHGRRLYAYGPRGEELAKVLVNARPKFLFPYSESEALLVPDLLNQLIWYSSRNRRFTTQRLDGQQTLADHNQGFILLVGKNGIIRLFQKGSESFQRSSH